MKGRVDADDRALVPIDVTAKDQQVPAVLEAWIDTGFNGGLALPITLIEQLTLPEGAVVTAVLADGSRSVMSTYTAEVRWFGATIKVEVVPKSGETILLGTQLLRGHLLSIDYRDGTLSID